MYSSLAMGLPMPLNAECPLSFQLLLYMPL